VLAGNESLFQQAVHCPWGWYGVETVIGRSVTAALPRLF
jgi:hypothetical protein